MEGDWRGTDDRGLSLLGINVEMIVPLCKAFLRSAVLLV